MPTLYFSMPEDAINSLEFNSGSEPSAFVGALLSASASTPFTLSMNISFNLTVFSPNYIDIQVKSISTDLFLVNSNDQVIGDEKSKFLGESDIGHETFSRLANTTISPFLLLQYNRTTPLTRSTSDAVLSHLFNTCVNPNNSGERRLRFRYTTVVDVKIISFTGYKPTVSGTSYIKCPDLSSLTPSWSVLNQLPAKLLM